MKIKTYPCQFELHETEKNKETIVLTYDGQQHLFSRKEWKNELLDGIDVGGFNLTEEESEEVLNALENTSNKPFFREIK